MKKDERYWPVLGTWLKDTVEGPPDPQQTARRVAERLPETPQLRRHWWQLTPRRARRSPDRSGAIARRTAPIPATNGHTPTVIGRTHSMLSPAKAITAGALVFAIGGVMLVAQPFQQPDIAPGAETEAAAPTWVTGSMQHVDGSCSETGSSASDGVSRHSYQCTFAWTASDPRLTGDASNLWTEDAYRTDDEAITVGMDASFLRNEGGEWACSYPYLVKGTDPMTQEDVTASSTYTCIGSAGYEGLWAVLVSEPIEDSFSDEFVGLIFSGELPPVPEPPAAE
jgi:hypothetical protein